MRRHRRGLEQPKFDPVREAAVRQAERSSGSLSWRGAQGVGRGLSCIGPTAATEAGRVGSFGLRVDYATVRSGLGSVSLKQFASRPRSLTKGVAETDEDGERKNMTKGVTFHTRDLRILRSVICNRESSILNSFEFHDPMP